MTAITPYPFGPCEPWITGADLAGCCTISTELVLEEQAAEQATDLLFNLSGQRFTGLCERTVRPCPQGCTCWGRPGLYGPPGYDLGRGAFVGRCPQLSTVKLSGYPVREIVQVTIDGVTIDAAEYRLDRFQDLVRLDDADGNRQFWPGCQNFGIDEGAGTFFVTYLAGLDPPSTGLAAASQLACQLLHACPDAAGDTGDCDLPAGTVRVTRQGLTIEAQTLGLYLASGQTGLAHVDAFLAAWGKTRRPAVVMSPDVRPFAQEA